MREKYIKIKIKPNAKQNNITHNGTTLVIAVQAPAIDNQANEAIISYLGKILKINKAEIIIKQGKTSKIKLLQINLPNALEKLIAKSNNCI